MSDKSEWVWYGTPGHFICASHCRFHLCTVVGPWIVSTVGELVFDSAVQNTLAPLRGITLTERGDAREAEWLRKNGYEQLGAGPEIYETMVFRAGKPCSNRECGCGLPELVHPDVDMERYMTRVAANKGHLAMCEKWAAVPAFEPSYGSSGPE